MRWYGMCVRSVTWDQNRTSFMSCCFLVSRRRRRRRYPAQRRMLHINLNYSLTFPFMGKGSFGWQSERGIGDRCWLDLITCSFLLNFTWTLFLVFRSCSTDGFLGTGCVRKIIKKKTIFSFTNVVGAGGSFPNCFEPNVYLLAKSWIWFISKFSIR